jgi:hypothetical protein
MAFTRGLHLAATVVALAIEITPKYLSFLQSKIYVD